MTENQKFYETLKKDVDTEDSNGLFQWAAQWTVKETEETFGWLAEGYEFEDELVVLIEKCGEEYIFDLSSPDADVFGERHTIDRKTIEIDPDANDTWNEFAKAFLK